MKDLQPRSSLYTASVWAIFVVGATQLALVLAGNIAFIIAMLVSAGICAFFLFKFQHPAYRSRKNYARIYLLSAGMVFIVESLYMYLAFLEPGISVITFATLHAVIFLIPMLIALPFFPTSAHVSR